MIRYLRFIILISLNILPVLAFTQERTITGVVTDPDRLPLIAANITLVETDEEFFTDYKGSYHIVASRGQTLRFSYAGYQTKDVKIDDQEVIDVVMSEEIQLDEKIMTAYGIPQNQKIQGYAINVITSGELDLHPGNRLTERLQGRSNGFQVGSQGGGPGEAARLHFRGALPFGSGVKRQPLIVVDGLPIDHSHYTAGGGYQRTISDRMDDLHPEDIESISLLRGGEASALYGIYAPDGAMIITTKKGGEGLKINFSSSFGIESLHNPPKTQKKYSQGYMGIYDPDSPWPGWGSTVPKAQEINPTHPGRLFNNYKNAYQQGQLWQNTLSLSAGNSDAGFRASFGHRDHQGIIPHSNFEDLSGRIIGFLQPSDRLKFTGGFQYNRVGGNHADAVRFNKELTSWSPAVDVNDHRFPDGTMKGDHKEGQEGQNPIFGTETNRFKDRINHYSGQFSAQYEVAGWMTILYRAGLDQYSDFRVTGAEGPRNIEGENLYRANGSGFAGETLIKNQLLNSHLLLNFNRELTDRIQSEFLAGAEINNKKYNRNTTSGSRLSQWDKPDLDHVDPNSITTTSLNLPHKTLGFFGRLQLQYDQAVFLNLSHRTDRSRFSSGSSYFQSPSAGISYIFTEHFQPLMGLLDMGKIRASFALLSRDPYPFIPSEFYHPEDFGGFHREEITVSDQLEPEKTKTFETGIDLEAMGGKAGLSFSYFRITDKDIILPMDISGSSSISNAASIRQNGIEISLDLHPLQSKNMQWDIGIYFSSQQNQIISLSEERENILLAQENGFGGSSASLRLVKGGSFGDIYGTSYMRYHSQDKVNADKNTPLLIGEDGFPQPKEESVVLGNIFPDWTGSLSTRLMFRNVEVSVLLDTWQGLQRYNQMDNAQAWYGVASYTSDRNQMVVFEGMRADGKPNTKAVYKGQGEGPDGKNYGNGFYQNIYSGVTENFIENANWIRLRNLKFSYRFPEKWIQKLPISDIRLSASANNLLLNSSFKGMDPTLGWVGNGLNGDLFMSYGYPTPQRYIFTLDLTF